MARIKIKDLPKNMKVTKEELKKVQGGLYSLQSTTLSNYNSFLKIDGTSLSSYDPYLKFSY